MNHPFLAASVLVAGIAVAIKVSTDAAPAASWRGHYFEDGDSGRKLATIDARLFVEPGAAHLDLTIAAIGEGIDPVPGYRGVAGSNHITARELGRLLGRGLRVTSTFEDGRVVPADFGAGALGGVPERDWSPADGPVRKRGDERFPLELVIRAPLDRAGIWRTELHADGAVRLAVRTRVGAHGGEILEVRSLGVDLFR